MENKEREKPCNLLNSTDNLFEKKIFIAFILILFILIISLIIYKLVIYKNNITSDNIIINSKETVRKIFDLSLSSKSHENKLDTTVNNYL